MRPHRGQRLRNVDRGQLGELRESRGAVRLLDENPIESDDDVQVRVEPKVR